MEKKMDQMDSEHLPIRKLSFIHRISLGFINQVDFIEAQTIDSLEELPQKYVDTKSIPLSVLWRSK